MNNEPVKVNEGDWLLQVVGRPILVVLWCLVFWGTFYGAAFVYSVASEGFTIVADRVLSGRDVHGGVVNLALMVFATVVWALVGIVTLRVRAKGSRLYQEELARRRARGPAGNNAHGR